MSAETIESVIGRMLMVGVRGARLDDPALRADLEACRGAQVGGVILFDVDLPTLGVLERDGPVDERTRRTTRNIVDREQVRTLIGGLRHALGPELLVSVDQEGGAVRRLREVHGFTAVASQRERGGLSCEERDRCNAILAGELGEAGFDVAFAPCVDVAIEAQNTVVVGNGRCFAADERLVTTCAAETCGALARAGVAGCLKHYPGHGSSAGDTHRGLVDITASHRSERELLPYRRLIGERPEIVPMVMTGHLVHAGVDAAHPASLSWSHTTVMLRNEIGFDGVVVTDSLDMGAITQRYGLEEACVLAVNAGADLLLDANNAPGAARACPAPVMAEAVLRAVREGRIIGGEARLRESGRRLDRLRRLSGRHGPQTPR